MKRILTRRSVLLVLHFGIISLWAISAQPGAAVELPSNVLYIKLTDDSKILQIMAQNGRRETRTERIDKADFRRKTLDLYKGLESRRLSDADGQRMVKNLGRQILGPFRALIETADEVVFVVSDGLLETPLDLLYHNGQPLFLQKPVSYRVTQPTKQGSGFSLPGSALVVSDASADPERAAAQVASNFADSIFLDVAKVDPPYLRRQPAYDLLLMSVHGRIDNTTADHVVLGSGSAGSADDFLMIKPKLAYFDSCRLGVSSRFLKTFMSIGSLYFIAPILSNEAGNSSTKTMQFFFEHLGQGARPEIALFLARKKLWEAYHQDAFADRVWHAFPFRVYRLN
jgi:hypothetical protein